MTAARAMRALIPRVVKLRTDMPGPPPEAGPPDPGRAVEWWANDEYTKIPRWKALRWLGVNWIRWPYRESIMSYFSPANAVVTLVEELEAKGIVPALGVDSRVFEGGCNLGRNLFSLRQRYGCAVVGMDVSPQAIHLARTKIWRGVERVELLVGNVLTSQWFSKVPDDSFDLALTRWHLIHIPRSPEKSAYVGQLRRIARTLLVLEPVRPEALGTIVYRADGRYCLSWDDWESDYGLREFVPRIPLDDTRVFYASKLSP